MGQTYRIAERIAKQRMIVDDQEASHLLKSDSRSDALEHRGVFLHLADTSGVCEPAVLQGSAFGSELRTSLQGFVPSSDMHTRFRAAHR